jgi:hypothetical protein
MNSFKNYFGFESKFRKIEWAISSLNGDKSIEPSWGFVLTTIK